MPICRHDHARSPHERQLSRPGCPRRDASERGEIARVSCEALHVHLVKYFRKLKIPVFRTHPSLSPGQKDSENLSESIDPAVWRDSLLQATAPSERGGTPSSSRPRGYNSSLHTRRKYIEVACCCTRNQSQRLLHAIKKSRDDTAFRKYTCTMRHARKQSPTLKHLLRIPLNAGAQGQHRCAPG